MRIGYKNYIRSKEWARKKADFRGCGLNTGGCYVCGCSENLQQHHKTYKRLGKERLTDLILLCQSCHRDVHIVAKKSESISMTLWSASRRVKKEYSKGLDRYKKWIDMYLSR